jgi:Fe-S oxidoreductase
MFGDELVHAFEEFKAIWDPRGKMNPGKIVDPYLPSQNLRYGASYQPATPQTHFRFPEDKGSFTYAVERCVGVGECRRHDGGTMCPSYMVTHEEKDSTRGRARLLFEMLEGEVIEDGWREDAVREALDLCLACKGCKGDCPVNVDMATYKAEFYSHYYERRLRPVTAYTMGLIQRWARIASLDPGLANLVTHAPGLSALTKRIGGIASQRTPPAFAKQTLRDWFDERPRAANDRPRVMLWPDTFTNYFLPSSGRAATEVLESAGYEVVIPPRPLCCGRPLYDWGMLDRAQHYWRDILDTLAPAIDGGVPIVGLEPSCVSAFRDELLGLLPDNPRAQRLSKQTYTLSEFLVNEADWQPPQLRRDAIVQAHCHHCAIMKIDAEEELMRRLGLDFEVLDSGCCGMAGAFGFERGEHYEVSIAAGERVLLPKVREADRNTLVIADGFSCREQIAQTTDRRALHLAEVLAMALHPDGQEAGGYPERRFTDPMPMRPSSKTLALGAGAAAGLGALALARKAWRR